LIQNSTQKFPHPIKARVFQTATDFIWNNNEVHGAADAVGSRKKQDWEVGLRWMDNKGAMISTTEIIAFQLLKEAGTESFSQLSTFLKWKVYGA